MTKVAIVPIPIEVGISYQAVAGDKYSQGATAGEALDGLTAQLSKDEAGTLIIVQSGRPDQFFDAAQQQRLADLMVRWRAARERGQPLAADEQRELQALIEAELRGSAARASGLAYQLGR